MGKLVALNSLDISSNTLSGQIPIELENLRTLKYLNLSFNDLEGQVPTKGIFANFSWDSFQGNERLCGSDQEVAGRLRISTCSAEKKSNKNVLLKILIPVAISIILVASIFFFIWALIAHKQRSNRGGFTYPPLKGSTHMISYSEIWHATDAFATENLIDTSSQNESSTIGLKGSIGYIALVLGFCCWRFTGKKPIDEMFQEGLNLNKFASAVEEKHILEILDPRLVNENGYSDNNPRNSSLSDTENISSPVSSNAINNWDSRSEECLAAVIRVGLSCAAHLVEDRLTTRETLKKLQDIRAYLQDK
ncbi:hypothetical protein F0562_027873 [Nyssa sinensis]|uniref:Leucine-rich repeat-containing N-terminal plant-type domain-containing protein n=1 Tax=Nyssa sinensis TaxID=561372 RepID=A0A5J5B6U1_9ASTE|nr:hypothetical protein F0562_027873 [Nyssa sinensis]